MYSGPVSSCAPGTVLSGLAVYKDRADPVALPDSEYPSWLWNILDEGTSTSAGGITLESTAGMSKGEARAAQKRNLRLVRAAQRAQERLRERSALSAASAAGEGHKAQVSDGIVAKPAGKAEDAAGEASSISEEDERNKKRSLRKANRENIKAKNFVAK